LDIGVLGYIGIVQHKEHSPEVLSIPPGTPCIYCVFVCMCKSLKCTFFKEWWWVCDIEHCSCMKSGWSLFFFLLCSVPSDVEFLAVRRHMCLQLICIVTQKLNTVQQPRTEKSWSTYCTYCA